MAAWVCAGCTTTYSVGAPRCPHCGSIEHVEQGDEAMPKITRHGGPTIAGASVVGGSWGNEDEPDVWPEPEQAEPAPGAEGSEESSPGSSSETSPEKPSSDTEQSSKPTQSRARTTGSRSKKARTASSSAASTDGDRTADTSAADDE
jgi:hypothetical protein